MFQSIKNVSVGIQVLREWFGDGMRPVEPAVARGRASVCASCPFNSKSAGVALLASEAAKYIKEQLEAKEILEIKIEGEDDLKTCAICQCYLPLKIWCPTETYAPHTPKSVVKDFETMAPWCWQLEELNKKTHPVTL